MTGDFPLDIDALLQVLNHLNLGVYITDLDRRILLWNRKAEEITGHRAEDVVGRACHENVLVHIDKDGHELCTTDLCPLYRAMSLNKESEESILVSAQKADGSRVAVSVSVAPLRDESGNVVGGIETFRDETVAIHDLEFAKRVQRNLMPRSLPDDPAIRFDVRYYPHDLVGGDFFDIRQLGRGRYGVLVADVSGHGVSAALYTTGLKSITDSFAHLAAEPAQFLSAVGRELSQLSLDESFATAFYAVVGTEPHEFRYANAGHPPALHFRADGTVDQLGTTGLPLGVLEDATYDEEAASLDPGDLIFCYTDGIIEPVTADGEQLGMEGLTEVVRSRMASSSRDLLEHVYRHVKRSCGDVALPDDVLLLAIERPPEES